MSTKDPRGGTKLELEDAYNGVLFKLLMELLVYYGVSLILTRWLAAALQEKKLLCDSETRSPRSTTDNVTLTKLFPTPSPLHCVHKLTGGSEQLWDKPDA